MQKITVKKCKYCTVCKKKFGVCHCMNKPIGLLSAFSSELSNIQNSFTEQFPSFNKGGRLFIRGILEEIHVVAVITGIGMTNVAMTTQMIIDLFNPKTLIFSGIAGTINTEHRIATIIFPKRVGQYKYQKTIRSSKGPHGISNTFFDNEVDFPTPFFKYDDKVLSFDRPNCVGCIDINTLPPTNTVIKNNVTTPHMNIPMQVQTLVNSKDAFRKNIPSQFFFYADSWLLKQVEKISHSIKLPQQIYISKRLCYTPDVVIGDFGGSADTFLDNSQYREILFNEFIKANVTFEFVDMESASFAHVAVSNKIPFLVMRSLSDLAGGDAALDIDLFLHIASANNIYVIKQLFKKLKKYDTK